MKVRNSLAKKSGDELKLEKAKKADTEARTYARKKLKESYEY
jgi:hypothetical protein